MWKRIRNRISFVWYVYSLDWFQFGTTLVDILILILSFFNWQSIVNQPSLMLVIFGITVNFTWQVYNVLSHFKFLKKEDPKDPLVSLLQAESKGFEDIKIDSQVEGYLVDTRLGVMLNPAVDQVLRNPGITIEPVLSKKKRENTRTYIKQYKDTLLKFLNHKLYDVSSKGGKFTNDKKVCFASELYIDKGKYQWRINACGYFDGYLTNFIFGQFVGGNYYKLYSPMNLTNSSIKSLTDSDFSDHIGVSTLLLMKDNKVIVCKQGGNAGYSPNKFVPSGSGSMDFKDYQQDADVRSMIVRASERELFEETSLKGKLSREELGICTSILSFYRDMERGGKPEFCCLSRTSLSYDYLSEFLSPEEAEIEKKGIKSFNLLDEDTWRDVVLPSASLPLKMCYLAAYREVTGKEFEWK